MNNKSIKFVLGQYIVLVLILCASCQATQFDQSNLYGDWEVANWEIVSTGELRSNKMDMSFQTDGSYEVDYGTEKEVGKFWTSNDYLHTVETNQSEKKVKLIMLSKDTLSIQMNRAGELENVLLLRQ